MKIIKRIVAFFIAATVLGSATPIFASSQNTMTSVHSVSKDYDAALGNPGITSHLIIKPKHGSLLTSDSTIRLSLDNAKWTYDQIDFTQPTSPWLAYFTKTQEVFSTTNSITNPLIKDDYGQYQFTQLSENRLDIIVLQDIGENESKTAITIPMVYKVTGRFGTVKAQVSDTLGILSAETITVANISDNATKITIGSVKDFADTTVLGNIIIDELLPGTIKQKGSNNTLTLTLTSGFEFVNTNASVNSVNWDGLNPPESTTIKFGVYGGVIDRSVLVIEFNDFDPTQLNAGTIVIDNLTIAAGYDARHGDVYIKFKGIGINQ